MWKPYSNLKTYFITCHGPCTCVTTISGCGVDCTMNVKAHVDGVDGWWWWIRDGGLGGDQI